MKSVNMHEAKSRLSALVRDLREGRESEVVICHDGEPVAKLLPLNRKRPALGFDKGRVIMAPDFDDYDEEIRRMFEGE